MTPHQRARATNLIAAFGEAKREARSARSKAARGLQSAMAGASQQLAEAEAKERRLAEVLEQMDALTAELWRPSPAVQRGNA